MANHLSAIKTLYALNTEPFLDSRIKYYTKPLTLNRPFKATLKTIIDIPTLEKRVHQCKFMYMGVTFKAIYLIAFFSFLRISNLVPHSIASYSPLSTAFQRRHIFCSPGSSHIGKMVKSPPSKVKIIKIPHLGSNPLCPVAAVKAMLSTSPGNANSPLFQIQQNQTWVPLIDTEVRIHLKLILQRLHLKSLLA